MSSPAPDHHIHLPDGSCCGPKKFAHLHQHTQYSLLDGAAKLKDLLKWVKEVTPESPACAITDHGNMHGAVHFYNYAVDLGVKPILGYEAYVVPGFGTRRDRKAGDKSEKGIFHLTLLARDFEGYQNLCRLSSRGYTEGYYYKPRIDHELLTEHSKGVIAFSGCLGSEVQQLLMQGREDDAKQRLLWYRDLFGENYFIEIQDHGLPEQKKNNPILRAWAQELGIGLVATNDGHYVKKTDATAHETLLAIQTKATLADENRFKFPCDEFYVKSLDEMHSALPTAEWGEEPFDNTARIAQMCNVDLPVGKKRVYQMPALPIPEGRTMAEELRVQTYRGAMKRYPAHLTEPFVRFYTARSWDAVHDTDTLKAYCEAIYTPKLDGDKFTPEKFGAIDFLGLAAKLHGRLPGFNPNTADLETLVTALAFMGSIWETLGQACGEKYTKYPALERVEQDAAFVLPGMDDATYRHAVVLMRRAEYELSVINNMGFPDYFLIVADYINWAKDQGISVGPGRGCLAPNVPIRMADGTTKPIVDVKGGEFVLTRDGGAREVLRTYDYECDEELVHLTAYNGDRLGVTLTGDHEVLAEKLRRVPEYEAWAASTKRSRRSIEAPTGELTWLRARDLEPGDWVFVPTPQVDVRPHSIDLSPLIDPSEGIELADDGEHLLEFTLNKLAGTRKLRAVLPRVIEVDEAFARFLGRFAGDGWLRDQKTGRNREASFGLAFHVDDEAGLAQVEGFLAGIGVQSKRLPHARTKLIQLDVKSRLLRRAVRDLFPGYAFTAQTKHVPACVMTAPPSVVESFVEGLLASDGHFGANKTRLSTTSHTMAEQVRFLLLRLGIPSSLGRDTRTDLRPGYAGTRSNYTVDFAPTERFGGRAADNVWTYRQIDGGFLLKLKTVERVPGTGHVHDLKVDGEHNYLTSSFVVHNSGAGSLVAYAIRITNLDPLEYELLFERFLNPDRISMPDFDIDFSDARREEVIQYVRRKYGDDKVAQIATFGTMASKACLKDVARVMGVEYAKVDKVSKLIPIKFGKSYSLEQARESVPDIQQMLEADQELAEAYDFAQKLEGLTRHASVHAAGVVIGRTQLTDLVPLMRDTSGEGIVCQFDMKAVEDIGLIKMDFLGLRTLSFLEEAHRILKESKGLDVNFDDIPLDDERTYELLSRGDTKGVFQLEGAGIADASRRLKPRRLADIIALSALYRPGPMENIPTYVRRHHGVEEVDYVKDGFPNSAKWLEKILAETYGIPVYQEQIMQIASEVAGYSLGGADLLRRAMGKKDAAEMQRQRELFTKGSVDNGVPQEEASRLFDLLEAFANYGFNKCLIGSTEVYGSDGTPYTMRGLFEKQAFTFLPSVEEGFTFGQGRIVGVYENGVKPVFELRTSLGKKVTATGNHPFLTLQGWRNLEDLRQGDRIAAPARLPVQGAKSWAKHELVMLGWLLSEGNTCHPCGAYVYTQSDEMRDDVVAAARAFENTLPSVKLRPERQDVYDIYLGTGKRGESGRSGVRLWLERLGLADKNAREKCVPSEAFELRNEDLAVMLGRYWAGDGFVIGTGSNTTPFAATSSPVLARQLQHLLSRFGIVTRLAEKTFKYKEGRVGYTLHVLGRRSTSNFLRYIGPHIIGRTEQIAKLSEYVETVPMDRETIDTVPPEVKGWIVAAKERSGLTWREVEERTGVCTKEFYGTEKAHKKGFRRATIRKLAEFFGDARLEAACSEDLFWESVVSITPVGEEMTYDLTVEGTHNFVANDLVVHNSHSAAYGVITYQTAWLKANHPVEFMAALLTVERRDSDKVSEYVSDARKMGVTVLPPDINLSGADFRVQGEEIYFGLYAIKGLGENAVLRILDERTRGGAFKSLADFCKRIDSKTCNRKGLEALVKSGAFDSFGERAQLLASLEDAVAWAQGAAQMFNSGMDSLFGAATVAPEPKLRSGVETLSDLERLSLEKESLGLYISGHPLEQHEGLREAATTRIADLESWFFAQNAKGRVRAVLAGMIEAVVKKPTKSGGMMARFNLADESATIELVAFSRAYERIHEKLVADTPALVIVELESEDGGLRAIAEEVVLIEQLADIPKVMYVDIDLDAASPEDLAEFQSVVDEHAGSLPTYFRFLAGEQFVTYQLDKGLGGPGALRVVNEMFRSWASAYLAYDNGTILARFAPQKPQWGQRGGGRPLQA